MPVLHTPYRIGIRCAQRVPLALSRSPRSPHTRRLAAQRARGRASPLAQSLNRRDARPHTRGSNINPPADVHVTHAPRPRPTRRSSYVERATASCARQLPSAGAGLPRSSSAVADSNIGGNGGAEAGASSGNALGEVDVADASPVERPCPLLEVESVERTCHVAPRGGG